jgi:carbamate kinase
VDKDLAAALVAQKLKADLFLVLTDVPAVMTGFGTPHQRPLGEVSVTGLLTQQFPEGSMGPQMTPVM